MANDNKFREMKEGSKQMAFDDDLVGKKKLAFLGMLKLDVYHLGHD